MRRRFLDALDMGLYLIALAVDQARTSVQARRLDEACARRIRRAHPRGVRGDRR